MSELVWPPKPTVTIEGHIVILGPDQFCTATGDCIVDIRDVTFVTSLRQLGVRTLVRQFRRPKGSSARG